MKNRPKDLSVQPYYHGNDAGALPGPPSLSGRMDRYFVDYASAGSLPGGDDDGHDHFRTTTVTPPRAWSSVTSSGPRHRLPGTTTTPPPPLLLHHARFDGDESREESSSGPIRPPGILGKTSSNEWTEQSSGGPIRPPGILGKTSSNEWAEQSSRGPIRPPGILGKTRRRGGGGGQIGTPPPPASTTFAPCGGEDVVGVGGGVPTVGFVTIPMSPTPYRFVCSVLNHEADRLADGLDSKAISSGSNNSLGTLPHREVMHTNQNANNVNPKPLAITSTRTQPRNDRVKKLLSKVATAAMIKSAPIQKIDTGRQRTPKISKPPPQALKQKKPDPETGGGVSTRSVVVVNDPPGPVARKGHTVGQSVSSTTPPPVNPHTAEKFPKKKSKLEESVLAKILPTPRSSESKKAKEVAERSPFDSSSSSAPQTVPSKNLWDEARRQRYDDLKGRAKQSLSRALKVSPSLAVEISSTSGSTLSFNSILDDGGNSILDEGRDEENEDSSRFPAEEDYSHLTTAISYVSQPGFLPPADPSHSYGITPSPEAREPGQESPIQNSAGGVPFSDTVVRMSKSAAPPLPPNHRRSEFRTPKPRTTPSRGMRPGSTALFGDEDSRVSTREVKTGDEERDPPPETGSLTPTEERLERLDRIERTREVSSDDDVQQTEQSLGIPSLTSQRSSETSSVNIQMSLAMKLTKRDDSIAPHHPSSRPEGSHSKEKELSLTGAAPRPTKIKRAPGIDSSRSPPPKKPDRVVPVEAEGQSFATPYQRPSPSPSAPALDQRTVRMLYADEFQEMIKVHSSELVVNALKENTTEKAKPSPSRSGISFVVRKRPLLGSESEEGEFDVVDTPHGQSKAVVLYEASICSDRKTRDLKAHLFRFDGVFSDEVSNEEFYIRSGQTPVMTAVDGGHGIILTFGSSGSGKSHTITDFEERAAFDIFADASHTVPSVSVQYVELRGNQIVDLLGPIGSFARVVQSDIDGTFQLKGAIAAAAFSPDDLLLIMSNARRRFVTESIVRRKNTCRSYLLCQILMDSGDLEGKLSLLECPAGVHQQYSETKVDKKEASQFACLMENVRGMISGRNSLPTTCNLTKLMDQALRSERSNLCLVATVSPKATATEDTLASLLSLKKVMNGYPRPTNKLGNPSRPTNNVSCADEDLALPRQWSKDQLLNWMFGKNLVPSTIAEGHLNHQEGLSGRSVMRMTKKQLKASFYNELEDGDKMAQRLFVALRAENDRIARLRVKRKLALEKE